VILARFHGRCTAVFTLTLFHLAVSWLVASVITVPLALALQEHPDGVFALYGDGGRLAYEFYDSHRSTLTASGLMAALTAVLYGALWFVFGATIPVLGAVEPAPPLHRAASYSMRRLPTLTALAGIALTGYVLAGAAGWYAYGWLDRRAASLVDVRAADLLRVRAAIPAVFVAALVTVWHDVARVRCVVTGQGARAASVSALTVMVRSPLSTLGGALAWWLVGLTGPLVAYVASRGLGARREVGAIAALTLVQQLALAWRFVCRSGWLLGLGASQRIDEAARVEAISP
jgi:hypothetical protein